MEAAKPIVLETNKGIKDIDLKMIDIKTFDINLEDKSYIFEYAKSETKEHIIFKITENKNIKEKYYILYLNISELNSLNALFSLYQNIEEIYTLLLKLIIDNKYSISVKNNSIILLIKLPMPGGKIIDINFELRQNKITNEEILDLLYSKVNELIKENQIIKNEQKILKNKNDELVNKNNKLEKDYDEMKNENEKIKEKLKKIENQIEKLAIKTTNKYYDFDKSSIIKNIKEKKELMNWISSKGDIKEINLLYRASEDGDDLDSFYNKCGNKGPTISLIKTKKGRKFGGFSSVDWVKNDGKYINYRDNTAFLFSLDNMKKYDILKPEYSITCYSHSYILAYGNNADYHGIYLKNLKGFEDHSNKVYNVSSDFCLSGEKNFDAEEIEVFQIIFK